jgi:hypothetical protein
MKYIVLAFLLVSLSSVVYGGDSEKRENIEKLMKLTKSDTIVDTMYSQVEQMTAGMGKKFGVKPSEKKYLDKYFKKVTDVMKQEMSWEKMKEPMIQIYMKNFSEEELSDMVVFYESKTGRAITEKMPIVMQDSMHIAQGLMKDFIPKVQELAKELREELKAARLAD